MSTRPTSNEIRNNTALNRFELDLDGEMAVSHYKLAPGVITFTHIEAPDEYTGRGYASMLTRRALEHARAEGLKVIARCSFVRPYIAKHPEFSDLLAKKTGQ